MATGWGRGPWGYGEWGQGNVIVPETGSVSTFLGWGEGAWNGNFGWGQSLNTQPTVIVGTAPATGAIAITGFAPTATISGVGIQPGSAAVVVAGVTPTVIQDQESVVMFKAFVKVNVYVNETNRS